MSITNSIFTANTASGNTSSTTFATLPGSEGALRLFVAVLWVDGSSFQSNFASNVGGAIFFLQSCIQVRQSRFQCRWHVYVSYLSVALSGN